MMLYDYSDGIELDQACITKYLPLNAVCDFSMEIHIGNKSYCRFLTVEMS